MEGEGWLERWRLMMCEGRGLEISNLPIYTWPEAAFSTCSYRDNLKPRLKNAAQSQTRAMF